MTRLELARIALGYHYPSHLPFIWFKDLQINSTMFYGD